MAEKYAGWLVRVGVQERFVIPAILDETIADMIQKNGDQQVAVTVAWRRFPTRPDYVVQEDWPTERAGRAFAAAWEALR